MNKNIEQALYWFSEAAKHGCDEAQFNLGWLYYNKSDTSSKEQGIKYFIASQTKLEINDLIFLAKLFETRALYNQNNRFLALYMAINKGSDAARDKMAKLEIEHPNTKNQLHSLCLQLKKGSLQISYHNHGGHSDDSNNKYFIDTNLTSNQNQNSNDCSNDADYSSYFIDYNSSNWLTKLIDVDVQPTSDNESTSKQEESLENTRFTTSSINQSNPQQLRVFEVDQNTKKNSQNTKSESNPNLIENRNSVQKRLSVHAIDTEDSTSSPSLNKNNCDKSNKYEENASIETMFPQNPAGFNDIGYLYWEGKKVERDLKKSYEYFKKAAQGGNTIGMANLGESYYYGFGVTQDQAEAFKWLKEAETVSESNENLKNPYLMLKEGEAVANGLGRCGVLNLAFCYYRGHGTVQNVSLALSYLSLYESYFNTMDRHQCERLFNSYKQDYDDVEKAVFVMAAVERSSKVISTDQLQSLIEDHNSVFEKMTCLLEVFFFF